MILEIGLGGDHEIPPRVMCEVDSVAVGTWRSSTEEFHGGGGPSILPSGVEHPTLPNNGHDEELTNLMNNLST